MKTLHFAAAALSIFCATQATTVRAVSPVNDVPFKKESVYGKLTKDLFADASIVQGPHKTIYIAGMAAENLTTLPDPEKGPRIDHVGDFMGQCRVAYRKIKKTLAEQGANVNGIVRTVTYVTDVRYINDFLACQREALDGAPLPPNTFVNVSQLAWPGMLVEVQITAVAPLKQ
jgi:enamine deaminase RidA (YjgF/YER057c/UK114 family)